jgi:hypothetical protein
MCNARQYLRISRRDWGKSQNMPVRVADPWLKSENWISWIRGYGSAPYFTATFGSRSPKSLPLANNFKCITRKPKWWLNSEWLTKTAASIKIENTDSGLYTQLPLCNYKFHQFRFPCNRIVWLLAICLQNTLITPSIVITESWICLHNSWPINYPPFTEP